MITDYSVSPRPGFGTESIFYFCALAIVTTVLTIGSGAVAGQAKATIGGHCCQVLSS